MLHVSFVRNTVSVIPTPLLHRTLIQIIRDANLAIIDISEAVDIVKWI